MDLLNMTNRTQIHEFYNKEGKFIFQALKFGDLLGNGIWQQTQNFSKMSPKLGQPGKKAQGYVVRKHYIVFKVEDNLNCTLNI